MSKPKIDTDRRTGEVRCAHRDLFGNVCDACFDATPFLIETYGRTFKMTGSEWLEPEYVDPTEVRISAATPNVVAIDVTDVRAGDVIYGFSALSRPITVAEVTNAAAYGLTFVDGTGRNVRIPAPRVTVVRAA